jgi:hypothetical protein
MHRLNLPTKPLLRELSALKIILPTDVATELEAHLPDDIVVVRVDSGSANSRIAR